MKNAMLSIQCTAAYCTLALALAISTGCESAAQNTELDRVAGREAPANAAWPQWRGPGRDGTSGETGLLVDWTKTTPTLVWKRQLGTGFSSISVADNRLYTMAAEDGDEFVYCMDCRDGTTIWKVRTGETFVDNQGGDGPRSTPTIDGDVIFILGASGDLMALEATSGDVIWQRNILKDFGAENLHWGVSQSPLVDGDKLVLGAGAKGASIVALDKRTGEVIWKGLDYIAGYASPIKITVGSNADAAAEYVFFCGQALIGVAPEDGSLDWRFEWLTTSDMNIATPIYDPQTQLLFVSAARDTGRCSAYRLMAKDGKVIAEHVYTNREMRNHFNSCVLVDGYLYGYDNSLLKCIQLQSGEVMWEDRSVGKGSLIAAQGHLYVLGERGDLAVVEATPQEYREKGRFRALESSRAWTEPTLADRRLYIRDLETIACIDVAAPGPAQPSAH